MTWNLLGMLSNTFFRIKMQPKADNEGQLCLYCEHPTKSGGEPGGWMEREAMAREGGMAAVMEKQAVASTAVDTKKLKTFTPEEASLHPPLFIFFLPHFPSLCLPSCLFFILLKTCLDDGKSTASTFLH